ncbi:MAG: DGQHR domain-containing protein, partial [Chloroflexi bacterium]|nr:DGQHR domain-containing protein [Chloroflexota bacterium]
MSSTLPAMKGRMGDMDYYLMSLKASELVNLVKEPKNMPGWDDEKIEEIYQRKINYGRVRNQIAPYLANNRTSRFFGSLIVAAFNFDDKVEFTPLNEIPAVSVSKLRPDEKEAVSKIVMLTLHGGVMMAPLDGQHRLKALEFAMLGKDHSGKDISGISVDPDLANEDISVILLPYQPESARRIFTRVNRYARRPSASETYVTDDDDLFAVLARRVTNEVIGGRLVKYTQPTLRPNDGEFTTLAILYGCCKAIVEYSLPRKIVDEAKQQGFSDEIEKACAPVVLTVWNRLLAEVEVFRDATGDRSEQGDARRIEIRRQNLLGKPVPQECLVSAYLALTAKPTQMPWKDACERLNALPWEITEENVGG